MENGKEIQVANARKQDFLGRMGWVWTWFFLI